MKSSAILMFILMLVFTAFATVPADADVHPGLRAGAYFDAGGAFIGGEVLTDMPWERWYFNPNVEYVFGDNADIITFNFDVHYDLKTNSNIYVWLGGGPAIIHTSPDEDRFRFKDDETDFGLNLLMGIGFGKASIVPYIQPKVIVSDNSEFSLAFGVRF